MEAIVVEKLQKNLKYLNQNMSGIFLRIKYLEGKSTSDDKKLFDEIYKKAFLASKNLRNIEIEIKKNIR